jgi:hypothetical protein
MGQCLVQPWLLSSNGDPRKDNCQQYAVPARDSCRKHAEPTPNDNMWPVTNKGADVGLLKDLEDPPSPKWTWSLRI